MILSRDDELAHTICMYCWVWHIIWRYYWYGLNAPSFVDEILIQVSWSYLFEKSKRYLSIGVCSGYLWFICWLLMVYLLSLAINTKNEIDGCLNHEMVAVNNMHVTLSTCILKDTGDAIVWHMEIPYNLLRKSWWKFMSKKMIVLKL